MTDTTALTRLVGTWQGDSLRAHATLDGRFFDLDTAGALGRFVLDGHALVGCRVDATAALDACAGEHAADGKLVVRGRGWRTTFTLADDVLQIEATDVSPDGTEHRATLTTLRRVSA